MPVSCKTVIRMWNAEGYHKDVAMLNEQQIVMTESRVKEPTSLMLCGSSVSVVIDPKEFPEAVRFQILVIPYSR